MTLEKRGGWGQSRHSWTFMSEHARLANSTIRAAHDLLKIQIAADLPYDFFL
jgi:hypothetical protein